MNQIIKNQIMKRVNKSFLLFLISTFVIVSCNNKGEVTSRLENNLSNLNGEWYWSDDKNDDDWWLLICYDEINKTGTYALYNKAQDWGENASNELKTISQGAFNLVQGYDRYGDKAYVGKTSAGGPAFVITQIENRYAVDWLLRISIIEDEMFGKGMTKLTNECELN